MIEKALAVRIEAQTGKGAQVPQHLLTGSPILKGEPRTRLWFPLRFGRTCLEITDAFENEAEWMEHLVETPAGFLTAKKSELCTG